MLFRLKIALRAQKSCSTVETGRREAGVTKSQGLVRIRLSSICQVVLSLKQKEEGGAKRTMIADY